MDNHYLRFACQGCPKTVRIMATEKDVGKRVEIKCPNCNTKIQMTIYPPAKSTAEIAGKVAEQIFDAFKKIKKKFS